MSKFKTTFFFIFLIFHSYHAGASTHQALSDDLKRILKKAQLREDLIHFEMQTGIKNKILVSCPNGDIHLKITADPTEQISSFYYAVHKLGFLFPHPRTQMSPSQKLLFSHCNQSYEWRPSIGRRGFHLHTEHPSEWVAGFFEEQPDIARDTILWMARNFQNLLQIQMIKTDLEKLGMQWRPLHSLMKDLGIDLGLVVSFSSQQQRELALLPLWSVLSGSQDDELLKESLSALVAHFDFEYLSLEFGTSEFTSTDYVRTLKWLNETTQLLKASNKKTFAISHVSTKQTDDHYGNFNFLTHFADPQLGAQVHTVMFYGVNDNNSPVYGRKNFKDLEAFALAENPVRETWYYPENSYFIGMDIDVPLLLTDYLVSRSADYRWASDNHLAGHMTFSTGQELGYWLMDWNVALSANSEYVGDPLAALKLLGEDPTVWNAIIRYQTEYFKNQQVIQYLSTSNLMDELLPSLQIHQRTLLKDLYYDPTELRHEIEVLTAAVNAEPDLSQVHNVELKELLQITWLRVSHALSVRMAILKFTRVGKWIAQAKATRAQAQLLMNDVLQQQRYPDSLVFQWRDNPTSYDYGYAWPAARLFFWHREEQMVMQGQMSPWFMNIYNPLKLLLN